MYGSRDSGVTCIRNSFFYYLRGCCLIQAASYDHESVLNRHSSLDAPYPAKWPSSWRNHRTKIRQTISLFNSKQWRRIGISQYSRCYDAGREIGISKYWASDKTLFSILFAVSMTSYFTGNWVPRISRYAVMIGYFRMHGSDDGGAEHLRFAYLWWRNLNKHRSMV